MNTQRQPLWPYGNKLALLAAPVCWVAFATTFFLTHRFLKWPNGETGAVLLLLVAGISFVPIILSLFDSIASSRGMLDIKGIKIDFSQTIVAHATIELPANMGRPGPVVFDSSPMEIVATLEAATANEIVQLDIKDGDEWWVTRLMALCAGADRAGSPRAIVFVGRRNNADGVFLGWSAPRALLDVLRQEPQPRGPVNITYGGVYKRAARIAKQVAIFSDDGAPVAPNTGMPWTVPPVLTPEVHRYLHDPKYTNLGEAALEQILMDQFGRYGLEAPPDRLTLGRLEQLFSHCLYRDAIDVRWSKEKQAELFAELNAPFLAFVSGGKYQVLVERAEIERAIINDLLRPDGRRSQSQRPTISP